MSSKCSYLFTTVKCWLAKPIYKYSLSFKSNKWFCDYCRKLRKYTTLEKNIKTQLSVIYQEVSVNIFGFILLECIRSGQYAK